MAQLGFVRLLEAEQDQVDRCHIVGCKVVVGAVVDGVPRKLPHAEITHTYRQGTSVYSSGLINVILLSIQKSWSLTVDAGVLDVDGLRGLFVSRGQSVVDGGEDLQDAFGQAGLKHHAATPHTHVLTARVQVGNAHRH